MRLVVFSLNHDRSPLLFCWPTRKQFATRSWIAGCWLPVQTLGPGLAVKCPAGATTAATDIEGFCISEWREPSVALGVMESLAGVSGRSFDVGRFVAPRISNLGNAGWPR